MSDNNINESKSMSILREYFYEYHDPLYDSDKCEYDYMEDDFCTDFVHGFYIKMETFFKKRFHFNIKSVHKIRAEIIGDDYITYKQFVMDKKVNKAYIHFFVIFL